MRANWKADADRLSATRFSHQIDDRDGDKSYYRLLIYIPTLVKRRRDGRVVLFGDGATGIVPAAAHLARVTTWRVRENAGSRGKL
jgi:hypothetical protein